MKKHSAGFTLIELVMVIVILGILSAIALPKFIDLNQDAGDAAVKASSGAVKAAHAVAIAKLKDFPTVSQLITYVNASGTVTDGTSGVNIVINGKTCKIPTYSDTTCTTATGAGEQVKCVGTLTAYSSCT